MQSNTKDTPLLELLDRVPMNGRAIHETIQESINIPYGNLCYRAAMRIRELEAEIERSRPNKKVSDSRQ